MSSKVITEYLNSLPKEERAKEQQNILNFLEKNKEDDQNGYEGNDLDEIQVPWSDLNQYLAEKTQKFNQTKIKDKVMEFKLNEREDEQSSEDYWLEDINKK